MASDLIKWIKRDLVSRYLKSECPQQKDCLKALEQILDDEASEEIKAKLNDNMDNCWTCYKNYKLEKSIRDLVKYKMEQKSVPDDLLSEIKSKISDLK